MTFQSGRAQFYSNCGGLFACKLFNLKPQSKVMKICIILANKKKIRCNALYRVDPCMKFRIIVLYTFLNNCSNYYPSNWEHVCRLTLLRVLRDFCDIPQIFIVLIPLLCGRHTMHIWQKSASCDRIFGRGKICLH